VLTFECSADSLRHCFDIPFDQFVAGYTITDFGQPLDASQLQPCGLIQNVFYEVDLLVSSSAMGPFMLENWTSASGETHTSGTFADVAGLVTLLNQLDTMTVWTFDPVQMIVSTTASQSQYSDLKVREMPTNAVVIFEKKSAMVLNGTSLVLAPGDHEIIATHTDSGFADTLNVTIMCLSTDTINVVLAQFAAQAVILPETELPSAATQIQLLQQDINGNMVEIRTEADNFNTLFVSSQNIGTETAIAVICQDNCICDTTYVKIKVENATSDSLVIFTGLSPNGDGMNDTWTINGLGKYPGSVVMVFNRWGEMIMAKEDYKNDWAGTFESQLLPDGVYFYVLDLKNGSKTLSGYLSIMR
jgi:gliding motility-associated-like protein